MRVKHGRSRTTDRRRRVQGGGGWAGGPKTPGPPDAVRGDAVRGDAVAREAQGRGAQSATLEPRAREAARCAGCRRAAAGPGADVWTVRCTVGDG